MGRTAIVEPIMDEDSVRLIDRTPGEIALSASASFAIKIPETAKAE